MTPFSRGKISELLAAVRPEPPQEVPESSRITVHAAVSRVAVLYERIRNAVDYKDEHLLRKAAILRILKRQLMLEDDAMLIAMQLIRELIAARYLPNAALPESMIGDVAKVVKKYQAVQKTKLGYDRHNEWLLGIISAELEELLNDPRREKALINFLFEQLGDRITITGIDMDETERRLQVYIACHRAMLKADDEMMSYKLVRAYHSQWMRPDEWLEHPQDMALQMIGVELNVRQQLGSRLSQRFLSAAKTWAVPLAILRDALLERPEHAEHLLEKPDELHAAVGRIAERRYNESRARLRRGTARAMIYLFITKILLALAIEIPAESFFYHHFSRLALAINILFPPVLMFLVGSMIRVPGKENILRIQQSVDELLSIEGPKGKEIRISKERGGLAKFMFRFTYAATFLLTFGLVYFLLHLAHFTWISSTVFLFFLCVVSFFAFRLRLSAREYVIIERKEQFRNVLADFFSLPILRAGQWLSQSISRINVFIFLFDFIIEAPFKIFLNVLEEWFAFMKEKKEELQ
ncbi:MAG TPA: hypothetical protein VFQ60_01360 [Patescibacteria group bacterium]|nr:hypothetical protein [Patescibacteria group bacterium]